MSFRKWQNRARRNCRFLMDASKRDAIDTVRPSYKQQARLAQLFDEDDALAAMTTSQQNQNSTSFCKILSKNVKNTEKVKFYEFKKYLNCMIFSFPKMTFFVSSFSWNKFDFPDFRNFRKINSPEIQENSGISLKVGISNNYINFWFPDCNPKLCNALNPNLMSEIVCGMTFECNFEFPEFPHSWACNFRISLWDFSAQVKDLDTKIGQKSSQQYWLGGSLWHGKNLTTEKKVSKINDLGRNC